MLTLGKVPDAPVLERHATRQIIERLAEKRPFELTADECRYEYIHVEGKESPIMSIHFWPGPVQVLSPMPRNPSPG